MHGQENDIKKHHPVPLLRAILPLPFPMHKQCRQIMDRFLVEDRSFVILPPLYYNVPTNKKKRERKKQGELTRLYYSWGSRPVMRTVRKSIFEWTTTTGHILRLV